MTKRKGKVLRAELPAPFAGTARLYWAYGSNLNVEQMLRRCPGAKPLAKLMLDDACLLFRGFADVAYKRDAVCPGGLWQITPADEVALDRYEGVSGGLYVKRYLTISLKKGPAEPCLYYQVARRTGVMPPSEYYLDTIAEGYDDFRLDKAYLDAALEHSWNNKNKTPFLKQRWRAKGRPRLAREMAA